MSIELTRSLGFFFLLLNHITLHKQLLSATARLNSAVLLFDFVSIASCNACSWRKPRGKKKCNAALTTVTTNKQTSTAKKKKKKEACCVSSVEVKDCFYYFTRPKQFSFFFSRWAEADKKKDTVLFIYMCFLRVSSNQFFFLLLQHYCSAPQRISRFSFRFLQETNEQANDSS